MPIESANFINQLNSSYPAATDGVQEGDDHIRLLKSVIKNTFPNITGQVTVTQTALNQLGSGSSWITSAMLQSGVAAANLGYTPLNKAGDNVTGNLTIGGAQVLHAGNYNSYSPTLSGGGASGTWGINITGRGYPRRSDGNDLNFIWSGQGGQPTWLWGGADGANMYIYNPSNFSVNYANSANYANSSGSSGYANSAGSANYVAWGNVGGRPNPVVAARQEGYQLVLTYSNGAEFRYYGYEPYTGGGGGGN